MASFLRVLVLFAAASAPASGFAPRGMRTMATALGAEKINTKIDLESDKVVRHFPTHRCISLSVH